VFNPILQAKKFAPEARYIKEYLPELKDLPPYMLHDPLQYKLPYPQPIVNHFERARIVKKILSSIPCDFKSNSLKYFGLNIA